MTSPDQADAEAPTQANTGLCQLSRVWQTELWRNVSEISSWAPPHLERVRGSDGVQFRWESPCLVLGRDQVHCAEGAPLVATHAAGTACCSIQSGRA